MQWLLDTWRVLTISEKAAWWGAIMGTLAILWDAYKHFSPKSKVVIDVLIEDSIAISISNRGPLETSIKEILFNRKRFGFFKKPFDLYMLCDKERRPFNLPHKLGVGDIFQFDISPTTALKQKWFVEVYHSQSSKPTRGKLYV